MNSCQNKILINNLSKTIEGLEVLKDINIHVDQGELVSIVGPSGSGKSTIFNIIAGLISKDSGSVTINGSISYMYQKDMMLPWKKVVDNIAMPMILQGKTKKEARKEVVKYAKDFGISDFLDKYPKSLSGGMKQRANFLITYLTSNEIMLLDEPFGALDYITRNKLQKWLLEIKNKTKSTILFITHDIDEAIFISDRIYVISDKPSVIRGEINLKDKNILAEGELIKSNILKLLEN